MEQLTGLGKAVMTTDPDKLRLDLTVKNILAYKPILARIIKWTVTECHDMDYDEVEACIGEKVLISKVPVDSGITNMPERIDGLNTEAFLNYEGLNRYDIRTYLLIPKGRTAGKDGNRAHSSCTGNGEAAGGTAENMESDANEDTAGAVTENAAGKEEEDTAGDEVIKLLINVEAQNEDKPGYDISLRALFYCCRMISAQQDVEFTTDKDDPVQYGNIKKVYSIWVCTEAAQIRANSIEKYDIRRSFLYGYNPDTPRYDILEAILINISKKRDTGDSDNELINLVTCLLDTRIAAAEKVKLLRDDYHLRVSRNINEEVAWMGSFADGFEKRIREEVEQELKGDYDRQVAESKKQAEECRKLAEESRKQAEESRKQAEESKREAEENKRQFIAVLVRSLSSHTHSFDQMYKEVTSNSIFADVTREELKQVMASASCTLPTL